MTRGFALIFLLILIALVSVEGRGAGGAGRGGGSRSSSRSGSRGTRIRFYRGQVYRPGSWKTAAAVGTLYGLSSYKSRRLYYNNPNKEPEVCFNERTLRGGTYGYFICPEPGQPDSYQYCCGMGTEEKCCTEKEHQKQKSLSILIMVIIVAVTAVLVTCCLIIIICVRRRRASSRRPTWSKSKAKKTDSLHARYRKTPQDSSPSPNLYRLENKVTQCRTSTQV